MKNNLLLATTASLALFAFATLQPANAAEAKKPTLVVAKTESSLPVWQPAIGEGLAEMMITELGRLTRVSVLESTALDDLRDERRLGETGEVEKSERAQRGHFKGADYTFKTTITRFGAKESNQGGRLPILVNGFRQSFNLNSTEHEVQIDWRVIDNTTREVVKSGRGQGLQKGKNWSFNGGYSRNREWLDSGLGKAAMAAVGQIAGELQEWEPPTTSGASEVKDRAATAGLAKKRQTKGEVTLAEAGKVWVDLGTEHGLSKGEKLKIYRVVEKKNSKGKVIATDYELVAEVEVTKAQKDKSCASLAGGVKVEEGWAVAHASVDISTLE